MVQVFKNSFYFVAGIIFLLLAKIKNLMQGYSTPKPFSLNETTKCIEYGIHVVDDWLSHLQEYTNVDSADILNGSDVLELGPGSDLGIGLYLLSKKAKRYNAVDVNNLVDAVPDSYYDEFFDYLKSRRKCTNELYLRSQLEKLKGGDNDNLNYVCRDDFDIHLALEHQKIDLVFSQAAFEHFDNIDDTVRTLSKVARKGAIAIILVDLKTHSRWITDKDPINIYRYPPWLYRLFKFRGSPNRMRPYQYKKAFEKHGWGDIEIKPGELLPDDDLHYVRDSLSAAYKADKNQMEYLSMWLYAKKM